MTFPLTIHELSGLERPSILTFVQAAAADGFLSGRVLDYGCGKQLYRPVVERAGGVYYGFDRARFGGNVSVKDVGDEPAGPFDAVLCTQVLQYVDDPTETLTRLASIAPTLVMTYPTFWPEIRADRWRFTRLGMETLLGKAGFRIVRHERRAQLDFDGFELALGYGVIATAA